METKEIEEIDKLITDFDETLKKEEKKLPFHINIIDELNANENAHTRILMKLLKYSNENGFVFAQSFCKLFNLTQEIEIEKPTIEIGSEYIDGLIEEKGKYGIIIENKIHYAVDQDKQFERYISTVENHNMKIKNIYAVYLTRDGNKIISDSSLTDKAKKYLDYEDENNPGRFIPLNYKDDILPWLKTDILPNCKIKEEWLISAVQQYIDHLEGLFYTRQIETVMNDNLKKYLEEKLELSQNDLKTNFAKISQKIEQANKLSSALDELKNSILNKKDIIEKYLDSQLRSIAKSNEMEFSNFYSQDDAYFYFFKQNWVNRRIKFKFEKVNYIGCIFGLDNGTDSQWLNKQSSFSISNWTDEDFVDIVNGNRNIPEEMEKAIKQVLAEIDNNPELLNNK